MRMCSVGSHGARLGSRNQYELGTQTGLGHCWAQLLCKSRQRNIMTDENARLSYLQTRKGRLAIWGIVLTTDCVSRLFLHANMPVLFVSILQLLQAIFFNSPIRQPSVIIQFQLMSLFSLLACYISQNIFHWTIFVIRRFRAIISPYCWVVNIFCI
jgi:hypothetical protein